VVTITAALAGLVPRAALAADRITAAACIEANEAAGPLKQAGKLREARASLRLCSSDSCPIAVRKDCIAGATQLDVDVPTITFSVQGPDGNDLATVTVKLDGQLLLDHLDGKAVDVDPGSHVFRFEAPGLPPIEKTIVVSQGVKNRQEQVTLGEPRRPVVAVVVPPPPPTPPQQSKLRSNGILVAGGGLIALAGGAVAGLVATLEWSAAKDACGSKFPATCTNPSLASSDRSATVTAGTVADIALGVGGVALVTGAAMILLAPAPGSQTSGLQLAPMIGPSATGLTLGGSF
jgi:hypothetical protein